MKSVLLTAYGDVDKLEIRDVPAPSPGLSEIAVRMSGASINPIDWKLRSGALVAWMPLQLPAALGRDASGVVVAVGPGPAPFPVGTRVMGLVNGGYSEVVVAPVDAWAEVPAGLDLVDAGALPLVLLTGAQLIEIGVKPRPADVVLVTGALGSVGRVAVHVAKSHGAEVWAGVRANQRAEAETLGAYGIVALDGDVDADKLPQFDAIADTVGGATVQKMIGSLKPGGTIGTVVGEPQGAKARGFVVHSLLAHPDSERLAALAKDVADGKLIVPIAARLPLSEARDAQLLAQRGAGGKVVLMG